MLLHFQTLWVPWEGMNRISLWLLRIFLVLATFFSGLEKTYSYLILNHSHTLETNPFPRLIIQNTGLLAGHIIGFGLSAILMCLLYKISIELDHPLTISVGGGILATAFSLYLSVFLYNLRNLQMLEAILWLKRILHKPKSLDQKPHRYQIWVMLCFRLRSAEMPSWSFACLKPVASSSFTSSSARGGRLRTGAWSLILKADSQKVYAELMYAQRERGLVLGVKEELQEFLDQILDDYLAEQKRKVSFQVE